jgi:CAS/CSE protein, C-terminus
LYFVVVTGFTEFIPYVFQVLALLLEMHADGSISAPYLALFPHLLLPALWSRDGNIPPLVRLLQAYIGKGVLQMEADKLVCDLAKVGLFLILFM